MSDKVEKPVKMMKVPKEKKTKIPKEKKVKLKKNVTLTAQALEKTAVDFLIEEFCDDWPIEMVKFNQDDGGHHIEIFVEDSRANEFRIAFPPKYRGFSTVVIGCDKDWGKS